VKALLALILLAAAASASYSAPWWLLLALMLAVELRPSARTAPVPFPAFPTPPSACPACSGEWRDVPRHLAFVHQETVVMEIEGATP
jgi:hypothetical protein